MRLAVARLGHVDGDLRLLRADVLHEHRRARQPRGVSLEVVVGTIVPVSRMGSSSAALTIEDAIGLSDTAAAACTDTPRPRAPTQINPFDVCSYPNARISICRVRCEPFPGLLLIDRRAFTCAARVMPIPVRLHAASTRRPRRPRPHLTNQLLQLNSENTSSVVVRKATGS